MNDDAWTVFLTMMRTWGLDIGAANSRPSEAPAGLQVIRLPILVNAQTAGAAPTRGARFYVDRPTIARLAPGGAARACGSRSSRAPDSVDRRPGRLPQGQAIRPRRTKRLGSLIQKFLALRSRRMGPRLSGLRQRVSHPSALASWPLAQHAVGRGFAESFQDGEAANAEPP